VDMPDEQARRIRFTFHPSHPSPVLSVIPPPIFKLNRKRFQLNLSFFRQLGEMVGSSDKPSSFAGTPNERLSSVTAKKNKKAWFCALSYDISPHQSIILSI
jgi:hypothetical protein